MSKKKIILLVLGMLFLAIMVLAIYKNISVENTVKNNTIQEYVPEKEISDEQSRMTLVTLYVVDTKNGELKPIAKNIDSKELLGDPYDVVLNLWIEESKIEGLKLNGTSIEKEVLTIDFSEEFIKDKDLNSEEFSKNIDAIINTVLEFKDITKVKFLVDGQEVDELKKF